MRGGRRWTFVAVRTVTRVAALAMLCGATACAKSRPRTSSELDADVAQPTDGGARRTPSESRQPEPDASAADAAGRRGEPLDAGGDRPVPIGDAGPDAAVGMPPPTVVKPPPDVVYERAEGAAVLDIDPDEPRTWIDRIFCEKMLECGFGGVELLTQAECEALMGGPCASYPQVPEEDVDPDCIQAADDASCNDLPLVAMTPACLESLTRVMSAIAGATELAAEGESCGSNTFCESGLACRVQNGFCGVCGPYGQVGDDCSDQPCLGGYCDPETLLCQPYARTGEPCDWTGGCPVGCGLDGRCRGFFDVAFQPPPLQYSGCTEDAQCFGAGCLDGYCLPPAPLGASCERDEQCSFGRCHEGVCATSASCELPGEGEYCARGSRCAPPLMCQGGRCIQPLGYGDPRAVGEDCVLAAQCTTGYCADGVCAVGAPGFGCQSDDECPAGRCVYNLCVPEFMQMCAEEL